MGGMGSAILEFMSDHNYKASVIRLGIPDKYVQHGTQAQLYKECGYDKSAMVESAEKMIGKTGQNTNSLVS